MTVADSPDEVPRAEMIEANTRVKTDVRAGVEQMMLAVGRLNDATGIEKGAALRVLQTIADLRDGKAQPWLAPDSRPGVNQFGGSKLDTPERERRTLAVAARIGLRSRTV